MAGETLPPVVAVLQGDISDLIAKIALAKKEVESLDGLEATAHLNLDTSAFATDLTRADGEFAAAAAAMQASADRAGGGAGNGGLLALLGWGGGAFGFAAFGSVLSLAGFGFEHLATIALGLAGSLAGALTGAAILAAGALAKMAVGMGSDILVMLEGNQAIKALIAGIETAPNATPTEKALAALAAGTLTLAQATTLYGSAAALAMQQTAQLTITTDAYWLKSIAPALIQLSLLKDSLLGLAQTYIPLIAWAAQKNFPLIRAGLQPLLDWLEGPTGIGIFKNLEEMFATTLPSAMMAFDNGVEWVIKILNYAAGFTGTFIANLALWLQKMNNAPPSTWEKWVNTLIGMFQAWWDLIKQIGITVYDLFSQSVGLGTSIVTTITAMLVQLDKWLTSTSGKASIHNLFTVHLQEIMAILGALGGLIATFAQLYLVLAPLFTGIATALINMIGWLEKIPGAGPFLTLAAAVGILGWRMGLVGFAQFILGLVGIVSEFGIAATASAILAVAMDAIPIFALITGITLLITGIVLLVTHWQQVTAWIGQVAQAFSSLPVPIQILLSALLPFISIPLLIISHWQQIVTFFHNLPGWIMDGIKALPGLVLNFFEAIPGAVWKFLTSTLPKWESEGGQIALGLLKGLVGALPSILGFFVQLPLKILGLLLTAATWLITTGVHIVGGLLVGLVQALPSILAWVVELPFRILALLVGAAVWLVKTGISVVSGFLGGVGQAAPHIWQWFISLPGWILSHLVTAASWLIGVGISVISGFLGGIGRAVPAVWSWFTALPGHIIGFFGALPGDMWNIAVAIFTGFWHGLKSVWNGIFNWLKGVVNSIIGFFKSALGIASPSTVMSDIGSNVMVGLQNGLAAGLPGVLGVMRMAANGIRGSLSGGSMTLAGTASASILHSLATGGLPTSPSMSPSVSMLGAGASLPSGGGGMSAVYNVNVVMPAGATASPQVMKAVIVQALEQHDNDLMRQMGGRPRIGAMQ